MGAIRRWSVLITLVSLVLMTGIGAIAHAQGATPAVSSASGILAQSTVDALPDGDAQVWLGRLAIEPGGIVSDQPQAGPVLIYVESGLVSVTSDTPLEGMIGGERIADMQPDYTCPCQQLHGEPAGWSGSLSVASGQSTLVPAAATQGLANHGTVPASVLVLTVGADTSLTDGQDGVSVTNLATGDGSFGGGPYLMTIERAALGGESPDGGQPGGLEVGAIESGSAEATVASGSGWALPGYASSGTTADAANQPTSIEPGVAQAFATGDSYAVADGELAWAAGNEPVTVLRAMVSPS